MYKTYMCRVWNITLLHLPAGVMIAAIRVTSSNRRLLLLLMWGSLMMMVCWGRRGQSGGHTLPLTRPSTAAIHPVLYTALPPSATTPQTDLNLYKNNNYSPSKHRILRNNVTFCHCVLWNLVRYLCIVVSVRCTSVRARCSPCCVDYTVRRLLPTSYRGYMGQWAELTDS